MFNGFNKGFSLGFAGRVFNRGFSTKILSITKTTEVVEENTADITVTPFSITAPDTFTVSYASEISGQAYIVITADAASFNGQQIAIERIGTNTNTTSTIFYNNSQNNVTLAIGQIITFTSNGNVWSTGSDGLGGITPPDDGLSGPDDGLSGPGDGGAGPAPP